MEVDRLGDLIAEAKKFVLENDRAQYQPYFETAERFCSERGVVIGGLNGIKLLLGEPLTKDSFFWELYCADTFAIAKDLVEVLYATKVNHIDSRTLNLQTNIKNREFTIAVDARILFKVYSLDMYRGVSLSNVMGSVQCDGWFGSKVNVFPPAIVLISLYQNLYSPSKCGQWEDSLTAEKSVYKKFIDEDGTDVKEGGFDKSVADDILLRSLLKDKRIVLIGDYAASKYGLVSGSRIQILTDIPPEELSAMTSRVLSEEKNQLRRVKVTHTRTSYARFNLNIPSDFQISKHTMYAVVGGEQIPLFDVFNSPEYEQIPYVVIDKIQIATPYVLLRFVFIDIWIIKLIIGIEQVKNDAEVKKELGLKARINSLKALASKLRDYAESKLAVEPFHIFSMTTIGVNTSETVAKKKLIANVGYRLPNIYPALNTN